MRVVSFGKTLAVMALLLGAGAASATDVPVQRNGYVLRADLQGGGATAVVFESGFGQGLGVWKDVIAGLGADCTCVAYARAGLGKSGSDGKPKTIEQHVSDLAKPLLLASLRSVAGDKNVSPCAAYDPSTKQRRRSRSKFSQTYGAGCHVSRRSMPKWMSESAGS